MRDPTTSPWKDSTLGVQCMPDCPSDLALDELHLGEKKPAEVQLLKQHIAACDSCEARWDLREQGLNAFPELNREAMVARIHELSAHIEVAGPASIWSKVRGVFAQPAIFGTSMALVAAMMTAFYMTRMMIMTFHGENRTGEAERKHLHEAPPTMTVPLVVLAVLSLLGGYLSQRERPERVARCPSGRSPPHPNH